MLDAASRRLRRMARGRYILPLLAAVLAFNVGVFPLAASRIDPQSRGGRPLDLRFGYSPEEAYAVMRAYGPEGRRAYMWIELTADVVYPAAYTLFLALCLTYLAERAGPASGLTRRATLLPFAVLAADYAENAAIVTMLARYPERADSIARVGGVITAIKWLLFVATFAALAAGLGRFLGERVRGAATARRGRPR
jgi:hypothetical protein